MQTGGRYLHTIAPNGIRWEGDPATTNSQIQSSQQSFLSFRTFDSGTCSVTSGSVHLVATPTCIQLLHLGCWKHHSQMLLVDRTPQMHEDSILTQAVFST
ncbi:MAG TPA: hypothetical protein DEF45_14305 [Rhodopirellula sp.]|nr:MAG: hypothetical protein CBD74_09185 [Saprospirales bacterium TMED214]HBV64183.1 hypothetical protein [Rhodopirellula sp.]